MSEPDSSATDPVAERLTGPPTFSGRGLDVSGPGNHRHSALPADKVWTARFDDRRADAGFLRHHFPDQTFDVIHSGHLLQHLTRHPWHCLQDWSCLLQVGGHLLVTSPDTAEGLVTESRRQNGGAGWAFVAESQATSPNALQMRTITSPLAEAGMEVVEVRQVPEGAGGRWEILAVKRAHVDVRTPVFVRRQHALGDTIAVSAFYNHLATRHAVTLQTSSGYLDYHLGVTATADLTQRADVDLDGYDQAHPYTPLYLLGFQQTGIPIPDGCAPRLRVTDQERAQIESVKSEKYVVIDISSVPLMSRSVYFDALEIAEYLDNQGLAVKYLQPCSPREFVKVIGAATLVIGRDSGTIQLAQALEVPFVSVMSSVLASARYLARPGTRALSSPCPVGQDGCYHRFWLSRDCPVPIDGVAPCGIIPTDTMIKALDDILHAPPIG